MKSAGEIIAFIAYKIGYIYYNQPMYGFSGKEVNELLIAYHELWAEIMGRREEFTTHYRDVLRENPAGTAQFPKQYLLNNPESSQEEIAQFVVTQWRKISNRLGISIPDDELKAEFDRTHYSS